MVSEAPVPKVPTSYKESISGLWVLELSQVEYYLRGERERERERERGRARGSERQRDIQRERECVNFALSGSEKYRALLHCMQKYSTEYGSPYVRRQPNQESYQCESVMLSRTPEEPCGWLSNYVPFWGPYYNTAPTILEYPKTDPNFDNYG